MTYFNDIELAKMFLSEAAKEARTDDVAMRAETVHPCLHVQKAFGGAASLAAVIRDLRQLNRMQNEAKHKFDGVGGGLLPLQPESEEEPVKCSATGSWAWST